MSIVGRIKGIFGAKKETTVAYHQKGDAEYQKVYDEKKKSAAPGRLPGNAEEKSWEFLYDVTEHVLSDFSEEDKRAVADSGATLVEQKCNYQHVVKYGIRHSPTQAKDPVPAEKSKG